MKKQGGVINCPLCNAVPIAEDRSYVFIIRCSNQKTCLNKTIVTGKSLERALTSWNNNMEKLERMFI